MTFASREALDLFLRRHRLTPEKGLGQHFLADNAVVRAIVDEVTDAASVLEIGPGPGILTGPLTERHHVIALEIDPRMRAALAESAPLALIRWGDALQTDLGAVLAELDRPRALVSNLPYYITAPLLSRFAAVRSDVDVMILMMQKEVGDRIIAPAGNGERGSLSVYLQRLFSIERVLDVLPEAFLPPPHVRSVVLRFRPLPVDDDPDFERLVRLGFTTPRKTLANNLSRGFPKELVATALEALPEKVRPHELTEAQWVALQEALDA
ncbi:MAG: ribosomal RNA small subunit methyltransferase A [Armatimonadota bacterium]